MANKNLAAQGHSGEIETDRMEARLRVGFSCPRGFTLPRSVRAYAAAPLLSHHPPHAIAIQTFSIGNRERGVEER